MDAAARMILETLVAACAAGGIVLVRNDSGAADACMGRGIEKIEDNTHPFKDAERIALA
jgi:hypothetical protein